MTAKSKSLKAKAARRVEKVDRTTKLTGQVAAIEAIEFRPMRSDEMPFHGPGGLWSVEPPSGYEDGWMWGERMALYALLYTGTDMEVPALGVHLRAIALRV
jgi:hypothetical protein